MHSRHRVFLVLAGIAGLLGLVGVRLWNLQVVHGSEYEEMARENRLQIRIVRPLRGRILDRKGRLLAEDRPRWTLSLRPGRLLDRRALAEACAAEIHLPPVLLEKQVGRGWGRTQAHVTRLARRKALDRTLERVAAVTAVPQSQLWRNLRRAERKLLQEGERERVRVLSRLLAEHGETRAPVRRELRRLERELTDTLLASVAEDELVLLAGPLWDGFDRAAHRRRDAVLALAADRGADLKAVVRKLREVERATLRYLVRVAARRDHVIFEGFLPYRAVLQLEVQGERLPGVAVEARPARVYPRGATACHALGYVGFLGWTRRSGTDVNLYEEREESGWFFQRVASFLDQEAYTEVEARGEFLRDLFGKTGVEKTCDSVLRGARGACVVECDRLGRVQKDIVSHAPSNGASLTLTLDAALQEEAARAFREVGGRALPDGTPLRGAVVLLCARTGAVLVLLSVPDFDPNDLIPPVCADRARALFTDQGRPLLNRAASGCYPPGSTFKPVTALAAMAEGLVEDPEQTVACDGAYEKHGHRFRCNARYGHGALTLPEALMVSCNVYFYSLGDSLGSKLGVWAQTVGLGRPTGLDLAGEKGGTVPYSFLPGFWIQMAIGQGLTATPLQVARLAALIANRGRLVTPHLSGPPGPGYRLEVADSIWDTLQEGCRRVVHGSRGTARLAELRALAVAGKTGTAETGRRRDGVALNHAWFMGYAPHDAPRYAVAVIVEDVPHGVHGGDVAAPIASRVLARALRGGEGR